MTQSRVKRNEINDTMVEDIIQRAIGFMPNLYKRIYGPYDKSEFSLQSRHHLMIMRIISSEGSMTVSNLAKIIACPKPQMTKLVNQLVESGLINRNQCKTDRRVINLVLTEKGKVFLQTVNTHVKEHLKQRFAVLTTEELSAMSNALGTIQAIVSKL